MLYDVFICHASEDKDDFVGPLAEELRRQNIEVWYDDFSLRLGDSIRQAIDKGLAQSRFGLIVLSKNFFAKKWTHYELDGLVERDLKGSDRVLLPIWHRISHDEVMASSPSLAGRRAVLSSAGLSQVVAQIQSAIHPQGSPFVRARDVLIEWDVTPPVITDEYWIDVVEASNRIPAYGARIPEESIWGRWSFPLPDKGGGPMERGERLAWTAMQMRWTEDAEAQSITPLTHPDEVHAFISRNPGLLETCALFPNLLVEYAPQVSIRGNEGDLAESIEEAFRISCGESKKRRSQSSAFGTATTTTARSPLCSEEWSIRHPTFGDYQPRFVANAYFGGGMFGPTVSPYAHSQHVFWLLSAASSWLPKKIHECLLSGMYSLHGWSDRDGGSKSDPARESDAFLNAVYDAAEGRKRLVLTKEVILDLSRRAEFTIESLKLPESAKDLLDRFFALDFPKKILQDEREMRVARSGRQRARKKT